MSGYYHYDIQPAISSNFRVDGGFTPRIFSGNNDDEFDCIFPSGHIMFGTSDSAYGMPEDYACINCNLHMIYLNGLLGAYPGYYWKRIVITEIP